MLSQRTPLASITIKIPSLAYIHLPLPVGIRNVVRLAHGAGNLHAEHYNHSTQSRISTNLMIPLPGAMFTNVHGVTANHFITAMFLACLPHRRHDWHFVLCLFLFRGNFCAQWLLLGTVLRQYGTLHSHNLLSLSKLCIITRPTPSSQLSFPKSALCPPPSPTLWRFCPSPGRGSVR